MGEFDVRGPELKKLIALAKRQPLTFAYNPGSGPKDDYFGLDKRKPPKTLGKKALEEGVGKKAAFGTATVEGKVLALTCVRVVPAIAKKLKKYLKSEKISLNVQVLDEAGSVLEDDIEEEVPVDVAQVDAAGDGGAQAEPDASPPSEPEPDGPDTDALRAGLKELAGRVQALDANTGKVFAKHYKQLAELFKAEQFDRLDSGLNKVNQALDKLAESTPSQEEGASEDAPENPEKVKWEALQQEVQADLDKAIAAAPTVGPKLEAAWTQIQSTANGGEYGKAIAAANKLTPALQKLQAPKPKREPVVSQNQQEGDGDTAKDDDPQAFEKAKLQLQKRLTAMTAALTEARRVLPEQASTIDTLSAVITGLSDPSELAAARKAANDLQVIADAGAERASLIAAALEEVARVRSFIESTGSEFEKSLGSAPPENLKKPLDDAATGLSPTTEIDQAKIDQTIEDALKQLAKSEKEIADLLADKAVWDSELKSFEARVSALQNHDKKDEDAVKAKLKVVTDGIVAAKALATLHKYKEASAALPPLASTCAEGEKIADACSQYAAIYEDRKKRVTDLLAKYSLTDAAVHDLIKGTVRKIKEDFDEAKTLGTATPPDFPGATKILKPLGKRVQEAFWRGERAEKYQAKMDSVKISANNRKNTPDASEIKLYLQQMNDLIAAADVAKTKSFVKSLSLLERAANLNSTMFKASKRAKSYKAALKAAKQNVKDLKAHAGHAGIIKHTTRLGTDIATAVIKAGESKFLHAEKICQSVTSEFTKLEALAVDYKAYLDAKEQLKIVKDSWNAKFTDKVSGLVDQVTVLEGQATTAVAAEDYKLAKKHIQAAEAIATRVKSTADIYAKNHGASDKIKASIEAGSGDFSKEIAGVEQVNSAASNFDKDNVYTTEISNAAGPIQDARDKVGINPQDDVGIKSDLEKARSDLTEVLDKVVQRTVYRNTRDSHKSTYDGLTAKDRGDAVKTETDAIDAIFTAAKELADTSKDSFGAVAEIAKLAPLLKDLARSVAAYDAYDLLLKGAIKAHDTWFDTADGAYGKPKTVLDKEFTAFGKQKTAADTDGKSNKWKDALAKLQKAKTDADLYQKIFGDYKKAIDAKKKEITDRLSPVDTAVLVKAKYDAMKPKLDKIDTLITERQYDQAMALIETAAWDIYEAQDTLTRDAEIKPKRDLAAQAVQKLFEVRCSPVEADYVRAKHQLDKVDAEIAADTYPNAMKLVDAIPGMCTEATQIGKDYAIYKPVREAADAAVADLRKDYPQDATVTLQLERFEIRLTQLNGAEAKRDFANLKPTAQAITDDVAKVSATAAEQGKLQQVADMLADAGPTETEGFETQLAAMRAELAKLKSHAGKDCQQVKDQVVRITRLLDEAKQEFDALEIPSARAKLAEAAQAVVQANTMAQQFVQMDAEVKALQKAYTDAKAKYTKPPTIKGLFDIANRMILSAPGAVAKGGFNTAMEMVKSAEKSVTKAADTGAAYALYVIERDKVKPRVDALISHKAHFSVADEVDEARLYFGAAEQMANALNPKEGIDQLKKCVDICIKAEIKADMHANNPPDEAKIKKLLESPDGIKELDEMFKTLDPAVQRKACKKVLEIRFGMNLEQTSDKAGATPDTDPNAAAPNVTRLFSVMAGLDDAHTRDNPSMAKVQRLGTEKGTSSFGRSYNFGAKRMTKNVKLRIGRADMPEETVIGQEWQLGEIDDNCKPVDDVPAKSFSWTTLHEIGHAVDDKYGVMQRNGKDTKYGGWKAHGGDVSEIAEKAAGKFKYPKSYIASYLSKPGGNFAKPEPDTGVDADDWEKRRLEAESWCDSIRSGKKIWYSATESDRLQVGGRVYQEAYSGDWVSYDFAARSQGVRGYQFRAPGEWFADIYAAFHSGKMNPKHPAREWLDKDMSN